MRRREWESNPRFSIIPLEQLRLTSRSIPPEVRSESGSIPIGAIVESGTAWARPLREACYYFCRRIPRVILLVFVLVSAAIDDKSDFKFKLLWY